MSLEVIRRLLYPRTIIMEALECQTDNVKSDTSDKKSQGHYTSADTTKHPMTSEKKSCKLLACMATPRKQLRITSIESDSGSPTVYQSASEQNDSEQEYRNIVLPQNQTQTQRKMIAQIIQEQSQKHPNIILREIVGRSFSTEGTVQKICKNQIYRAFTITIN